MTQKKTRGPYQHRLPKPTLYEKLHSDPKLHLLRKDFIINVSGSINVELGDMYVVFNKISCRGPRSCRLNVGWGEM